MRRREEDSEAALVEHHTAQYTVQFIEPISSYEHIILESLSLLAVRTFIQKSLTRQQAIRADLPMGRLIMGPILPRLAAFFGDEHDE